MRRRRKKFEEVDRNRWLISYADFITLLFAFFVVMYSISSVNDGNFRVLSDSIVTALHSDDSRPASSQDNELGRHASTAVPLPPVIAPIVPMTLQESLAQSARRMAQMNQVSEEIIAQFDVLASKDMVQVQRSRDYVNVELNTELLFTPGSAELTPAAVATLTRTGKILAGSGLFIEVEGHTDNVPIKTAVFPSNWELSAARAANVVHLFSRLGIDPARMVAIGYGAYRPRASNETPSGRRRNRRVVLVITANPRFSRARLQMDQ